jgi:hypothetical protein
MHARGWVEHGETVTMYREHQDKKAAAISCGGFS